MGHIDWPDRRRTVQIEGNALSTLTEGTTTMKILRAQAIRVMLALVAIAASGLVLEAGRRWQ
jgi:hypothetical protein